MPSAWISLKQRLVAWPRDLARVTWSYTASTASAGRIRIVSAVPGADPNQRSTRAAIYVSFDPGSVLPLYVLAQVQALAVGGWRVTFICQSPHLDEAQIASLAPHVREILHRRNWGHDFGGFGDGIARLGDLGGLHSLVLMNDSCYGPFSDFAVAEDRAEQSGCGIFGITESWAHCYHLQTYFLRIAQPVLGSGAFRAFWKSLRLRQDRAMVIANGELRFTQAMLEAGFTAGALCPYDAVAALAGHHARLRLSAGEKLRPEEQAYLQRLDAAIAAGETLNPCHYFWDVLVRDFGSPFIKRELLGRNPNGIRFLGEWEDVLEGRSCEAAIEAARQHMYRG